MREAVFAAVLLLAVASIVIGVALVSSALAFIVAGLLVAGWAWLVLSVDGAPPSVGDQ